MQPTLETFVPTRGSRRALAAVRALLRERAGVVLLHGPAGVGKTHLLRAAGLASGTTCRAVAEIVDVIVGRAQGRFGSGLLIVDDLHVLAELPMSQREVARQLVERARAGHGVLAAAGDLAELPELVGALRRVEGARLVPVRAPETREMTRLLLLMARRSGVRLPARAALSIAARCRGDVRLAEGAVARLRLARSMQG
jgi:chromosomal replication initiation ATPase DnaA